MKICDKHQVCYTDHECPACRLKQEIDRLEEVITELAEHILSLQEAIKNDKIT